jgi:AcrR family transcriptional regulator
MSIDSSHTNAYVNPVRRKKEPAPLGAREATKQETRDALIRAGMELFSEEGLDVPSLDALCARAGYTRGAFYVHFKDREEFIVAVMETATSRFLEGVLAVQGHDLDLDDIIAAFAQAVAGGTFGALGAVPLHQFLAACARSDALRKRYVRLLEKTRERLAESVRAGQRSGKIRRDVDALLLSGLLVAIGLGVGTLTELGVPFEAIRHARMLTKMLTSTERG